MAIFLVNIMFHLPVKQCTREAKSGKMRALVCQRERCVEETDCSFAERTGQMSTSNASSEVDVESQEEIEQSLNYKVCLSYVVDDNLFERDVMG